MIAQSKLMFSLSDKLKNLVILIFLFIFLFPLNSFSQVKKEVSEFKLKPNPPTLSPVTSPTNQPTQIISGTKEPGTSVWLNDTQQIWPQDQRTDWSYKLTLTEGKNPISLTTKNKWNKESEPTVSSIFLDTQAPTINITAPQDGEWFGKE